MSLRNIAKNMLWHPGGIRYGRGSWIKRPAHIENGRNITLGDGVLIRRHGYLATVTQWEGAQHSGRIVIGSGTYIGQYFYATALDAIEIGEGCVLSEQVYITDHSHGLDPRGAPLMQQPLESKGPVRIGAKCFLGYRCAIMPGVTLGPHCVVGASSVVTRSFAEGSMVAGSPARLLKRWNGERWVPAET